MDALVQAAIQSSMQRFLRAILEHNNDAAFHEFDNLKALSNVLTNEVEAYLNYQSFHVHDSLITWSWDHSDKPNVR